MTGKGIRYKGTEVNHGLLQTDREDHGCVLQSSVCARMELCCNKHFKQLPEFWGSVEEKWFKIVCSI